LHNGEAAAAGKPPSHTAVPPSTSAGGLAAARRLSHFLPGEARRLAVSRGQQQQHRGRIERIRPAGTAG
ncbi:MAG TPA: hypothetical protein VGZ89_13395, partial [Xanthobacteraceae bacterium]|nr:hypothetical protein [Xanthobacteraceae bacterium]